MDDSRWIDAALALASRGRGRTAPNPNVGCIIVAPGNGGGKVVGRGWTQPGGRPHAEAMALAQAGEKSRGATVYVTLAPCAHVSPRGPACADLLILSNVARVVVAMGDPDARTNGAGIARLREAGIIVDVGTGEAAARTQIAGFLTRLALRRPHVTLKLALSLDGAMALDSGASKWITGAVARGHAHLERARHEAILVGRATIDADSPTLDVRLEGLAERSPRRRLPRRRSGRPAVAVSRADPDRWRVYVARHRIDRSVRRAWPLGLDRCAYPWQRPARGLRMRKGPRRGAHHRGNAGGKRIKRCSPGSLPTSARSTGSSNAATCGSSWRPAMT